MIGRVTNGLLYTKCHLQLNGKMKINFNENLPNVIGPITKPRILSGAIEISSIGFGYNYIR